MWVRCGAVRMMQVDGMLFLYSFFLYILFLMNATEEATTPNVQGEMMCLDRLRSTHSM